MAARVILLNGAGSSGKTSIAKALQTIARDPLLHVQMDAFFEMLPHTYRQHPEGITFTTEFEGGKPSVAIGNGPVAARAFDGMRHAIAAMAQQGNNLVVDDVWLGNEDMEYARLLSGLETHLVGVFAPLEVLEERERRRGDRLIGLARWQHERVHKNRLYELQLDTSRATPIACARKIRDRFEL
jgi:chloramphenicol 3-O phosphotransferase